MISRKSEFSSSVDADSRSDTRIVLDSHRISNPKPGQHHNQPLHPKP